MRKITLKLLLPLLAIMSLISCSKDTSNTIAPEKMVIVLNQGNYSDQSGSISLYSETDNTIHNRVFEGANGVSLGAIIISGWVDDSKQAYLVCNNPDKIVIIDAKTAKISAPAITAELSNVRSVCGDANYIYASNWDKEMTQTPSGFYEFQKSFVSVYDARTKTFVKKVAVGTDVEGILLYGNRLFVATKDGVKVLDVTQSSMPTLKTIRESGVDGGAKNLVLDSRGKIWASFPMYGLVEIDPASMSATAKVQVPVDFMDGYIAYDSKGGRVLTYSTQFDASYNPVQANIYGVDVNTKEKSTIFTGTYFYGVGASPFTGNIFTAETSFSSNSVLKVIKSSGEVSGHTAGVGTSRYLFY